VKIEGLTGRPVLLGSLEAITDSLEKVAAAGIEAVILRSAHLIGTPDRHT